MSRSSQRRSGFTTVELLVVIAVIGLIAAIIVPLLLKEIQRAQATAIVEEWRLLTEAVMLYETDAGQPLREWVDEEKMPPELERYIGGEIAWGHPGLGLEKSFVRLAVRLPVAGWKTVYVIRTESPARLIDTIQRVHDGPQTAYVPGRSIALIID